MIKKYVLGFMFDEDKEEVLLIKKLRPDWQAGRINGIGGKLEAIDEEAYEYGMIREFQEETGIKTEYEDWKLYAIMECMGIGYDAPDPWVCYVMKSFNNKVYDFKQTEEEEPILMNVKDISLSHEVLPNLKWLIPLAFDEEPSITYINY